MANNLKITINDFDKICRACLSREKLRPLYEKCSQSICFADMLMACTVVKCAKDDGLPEKICTNCIEEINQAYSFAKHCKKIDTILRKCNIETELMNNSFQEAKRLINEQLVCVKVKQEKEEYVEEVQQEVNIEYVGIKQEKGLVENEENDDTAGESNEEDQDETYFENSSSSRRSTNSQIEEESTKNDKKRDLLETHQRSLIEKKKGAKLKHCSVCSKTFSRNYSLKEHMRVHNGDAPYNCKHCTKSFTYRQSLKTHIQFYHSGKKSYTCEICNKEFNKIRNFKEHMKRHTGEKRFTCGVCGKNFFHSGNFKCHIRTHTGEKLFSCGICRNTFASQQGLEHHLRIHTGDKPFACKVCRMVFTQSCSLKRHNLRKHAHV